MMCELLLVGRILNIVMFFLVEVKPCKSDAERGTHEISPGLPGECLGVSENSGAGMRKVIQLFLSNTISP